MSTHRSRGARRVYDRCEVCAVALDARPDPRRRRCADHLAQLDLFPARAVCKPRTWPGDAVRAEHDARGSR